MNGKRTRRDLVVRSGEVSLAGTLWLPPQTPTATVLMHPGSGPSDRDNDVYFPPIREHLLSAGLAVCSFDKRGVGGSTGRWQDAAIEAQADDALAAVGMLLDESADVPIGLFGHSQGGWVVVEAASRSSDVAFAVTNAGPGVTPGEQERYATRAHLERAGATPSEIDDALGRYDVLIEMLRDGASLEDVRGSVEVAGLSAFEGLDLPDDELLWGLMRVLIDYDPRPALERIGIPVLALFGGDDPIVPVDDSVAVYREAVRPDLLTVAVFPGADHRVQAGDPSRLIDGYLEELSSFALAAAAAAARSRV